MYTSYTISELRMIHKKSCQSLNINSGRSQQLHIDPSAQFRYPARPQERCPSGLRSTPGKCVYVNAYRGFESLSLRHLGNILAKNRGGESPREV